MHTQHISPSDQPLSVKDLLDAFYFLEKENERRFDPSTAVDRARLFWKTLHRVPDVSREVSLSDYGSSDGFIRQIEQNKHLLISLQDLTPAQRMANFLRPLIGG